MWLQFSYKEKYSMRMRRSAQLCSYKFRELERNEQIGYSHVML